jgi:hypothetical protein
LRRPKHPHRHAFKSAIGSCTRSISKAHDSQIKRRDESKRGKSICMMPTKSANRITDSKKEKIEVI